MWPENRVSLTLVVQTALGKAKQEVDQKSISKFGVNLANTQKLSTLSYSKVQQVFGHLNG